MLELNTSAYSQKWTCLSILKHEYLKINICMKYNWFSLPNFLYILTVTYEYFKLLTLHSNNLTCHFNCTLEYIYIFAVILTGNVKNYIKVKLSTSSLNKCFYVHNLCLHINHFVLAGHRFCWRYIFALHIILITAIGKIVYHNKNYFGHNCNTKDLKSHS